jgi:hypothetical protein
VSGLEDNRGDTRAFIYDLKVSARIMNDHKWNDTFPELSFSTIKTLFDNVEESDNAIDSVSSW